MLKKSRLTSSQMWNSSREHTKHWILCTNNNETVNPAQCHRLWLWRSTQSHFGATYSSR